MGKKTRTHKKTKKQKNSKTQKDSRIAKTTKVPGVPKPSKALKIRNKQTGSYHKIPFNAETMNEKELRRAERQRNYVKEVNKALNLLQSHIPFLRDMRRRVSHHKVLHIAILYIQHLSDTLNNKPTTDFEQTVTSIAPRPACGYVAKRNLKKRHEN